MMNSWKFAQSRVLWLLIATGVIAAALGCERLSALRGRDAETGPCPHYWSLFFKNRGLEPGAFLAGPQLDVPEYNDCQRLLVHKSGHPDTAFTNLKFDSVAAIWARADISNVYQQEVPIGDASGRPFYDALQSPNPATTRVTAIAQIWTTGDYAPLGIVKGFDCIVLQWEPLVVPSEKPNYHAFMVHVPNQKDCATPLDIPASYAHNLGARELPAQSNSDGLDEIPPVARWDWDKPLGQQYVGIACPSGWCELYGEDPNNAHEFTGSPNYTVPVGINIHGKAGRVVRQKGWYDEEYLASTKPTSGSPPHLDEEGAFGTVFPVPELKGSTIARYPPGTFVPVAWISINPGSKGYEGKFGLRLNTAPPEQRDVNALYLCLDDGHNKCNATPKYQCSPTRDHSNGRLFYARIGKGADDTHGSDFCVDFIGTDPAASALGTVRWRWLDNDPGIWVSCPAGCCQISKVQ